MSFINDPSTAVVASAPGRSQNLTTFLNGLAAWLGGIAFCFGSGVTGPKWIAAILTVVSVAAATIARARARRRQ
jgi:membrane protein implicated in regulation of membrane protease activity